MKHLKESFADKLSKGLPAGVVFKHYHVSTLPSKCPALYSAPPGKDPEKTYCESHFLLITGRPFNTDNASDIALFAIEVLIFSTAKLTTLFVSKTDSTGFTSDLGLPKHVKSPLRSLASGFVSHLIEHRHRPDRNLVLSLFSRAQGQYLFPGSIENGKKHALDDRQLVKWWCRSFDSVLREYDAEEGEEGSVEGQDVRASAYLVVPGHDKYETAAFFPASHKLDANENKRWNVGSPLRRISSFPNAPPRCLVPHFPDDPKARYLIELDEELANAPPSTKQVDLQASPSKRGAGHWKSVKTLEQFWDAMAFRQECSSGRLVGFIWIVFAPSTSLTEPLTPPITPSRSIFGHLTGSPTPVSKKLPKPKTSIQKPRLSGLIKPRAPRVKSIDVSASVSSKKETTKYYHAPTTSRGTIVLASKAYDRVNEVLLRLDFANIELARGSTTKWIHEASIIAGYPREDWGVTIAGQQKVSGDSSTESNTVRSAEVNVLAPKRKRKEPEVEHGSSGIASNDAAGPSNVNTLSSDLIRKKSRPDVDPGRETDPPVTQDPPVHVLAGSLVRKKAKAP